MYGEYEIIKITTGEIDSSWKQKVAAEIILRNLNNKYNNNYKMQLSHNGKSVFNSNRPTEAQLYRINQLEIYNPMFTGISKESATKYLKQYMKIKGDFIPLTEEESKIMSQPI